VDVIKDRKHTRAVPFALVFIFLLILVFWRNLLLFGKVPFDGDGPLFYFPSWAIGKRLLSHGFYFLWDPFRNMGQPFLAAPANQALYPLRLLSPFLGYLDYERVYVVFHVLLALTFGYLLLERIYRHRVVAFVGALAWAFNGYFFWRSIYSGDFAAMAWAPAALYFLVDKRAVSLAFTLTLQWFAGFPPFSLLTLIALVIFCGAFDDRKELLGTLAKATFIFIGLSAVQWIPFLEMLGQSKRALLLPGAAAVVNSLHPIDMWRQLIIPAPFLPAVEYAAPGLASFYFGPVLFALFVLGMARGKTREKIFGWCALVGLILAMGAHVPGYRLLLFTRLFRYPAQWIFLFQIFFVLVAASAVRCFQKSWIVCALIGLIALDLLSYTRENRFGWADTVFATTAEKRLAGLDSIPAGTRLFHTAAITDRKQNWDLRNPENWLFAKGLLTPSYGAALGEREVVSHDTLTSVRILNYAKRLNFASPDSVLFDDAGVSRIVALTDDGARKSTPGWEDAGVISNLNPKGRAFLADGGDVRILDDAPGHFLCEAAGPGPLVFSEAYYPGWRVAIDGVKAPLRAFEDTFSSVQLGPGVHHVRFSYRPLAVVAGALISVLTCLLLVSV
jgi:hypothetical protein